MNRFVEIAWMTIRTLPFLQTNEVTFTEDWQQKWNVLDESLRDSVDGLTDLGKKIGLAFAAMIDCKFVTSHVSGYVERA